MLQANKDRLQIIDDAKIMEAIEGIEFLEGIDMKEKISELVDAYKTKVTNLIVQIGTYDYTMIMKEQAKKDAIQIVEDAKAKDAPADYIEQLESQRIQQELAIDSDLKYADKWASDLYYYQKVILGLQKLRDK